MIGSIEPGRKSYYIVSCIVLTVLMSTSSSFLLQAAEIKSPDEIPGNITIGPSHIHPFLHLQEAYTDNVFRWHRDEKDDFINTVSPGLLIILPLRRHLLQVEYRAGLISYSRYSEYNTQDQLASILLNLDFPGTLNLRFGNDWMKSSTNPSFEGDIRNDFIFNTSRIEALYSPLTRYAVRLFYYNEFTDFDSFQQPWQSDPELDNYMQNDVGLTFYYRFLPLTSLLLEYGFTHKNNTDKGLSSTDSDSYRLWLGLAWEATAKINGDIKVGYLARDYDGLGDDWEGIGMEADVRYHLSSFTSISFKGFRKLEETSVTEEEGVYGTYYVYTGGTFSLSHQLTHKVTAVAEVSYINGNYQEEGQIGKKRKDDRLGFGGGIHYQIQDWLGCKLKYNYAVNDSNIEIEDYRENIITVTISLTF